ncbi:Protein EVI2A [Colius striatus]|uniref:Protein EVI2A n=1 Tax=Colius striatus TaxID=57412 RepID=A0A091K1U2_COLST|nr:Protein EVI2A [Colius striatus]
MKTEGCSKTHFAFPAVIIFSLCLQTSANHTNDPRAINETWNPTSQNLSGRQNTTETNTNSPLSIDFSSKVTTLETQPSTLQSSPSTTAQNSSPCPARSAAPATGGPRSPGKPKGTMAKEPCEDNKSLILICFTIIAVLVLICTFLLLATVVLANKMSSLRKAHRGKRRPRSNGDILATNSLWPTAAGTWQRMPKETTATDLIMQELISGRDAETQRKTEDESTEKLTKETDKQEKHPSKSPKPILANFVVEI